MNRNRPELHVTAEVGVLEAPAGAVALGDTLHVFHQFRPRPDAGARWAHQVASGIPYGWDVCDDVLAPTDDEIDCLAGSSVPVDGTVELFFVATGPATSDGSDTSPEKADSAETESLRASLRSNNIPHGHRGDRSFTVQRARISDLSATTDEISDDPSVVSPLVERLGPISVDDSAFPVTDLVTPSVIRHGDHWLMLALTLVDEQDAQIVVLTSDDRQHWTMQGPLDFGGSLPDDTPDGRPFSPRIAVMTDLDTGQRHDVLFITYPTVGHAENSEFEPKETTGYLVGTLEGSTFTTTTPYTVLDHGHDFTRPRLVQGKRPVIAGLVGAFPTDTEGTEGTENTGTWANCLSIPRFLSLRGGHLYQDVVGLPTAVRSFTDRAAVFTAQLDVEGEGASVTVNVVDDNAETLLTVTHSGDHVTVDRHGDTRTAPLADGDSDTLTIFVDGPVCEVFADGGLVSLTTALQRTGVIDKFEVAPAGDATIISTLESLGRTLQRRLAHLEDPEEQERLIREAALADRDLTAGIDPAGEPGTD